MQSAPAIPTARCYAVKCDKCSKTTWKGCGQHVDAVYTPASDLIAHLNSHRLHTQVMKDVNDEDKCVCPRE
ncbi:hypothetical protein B0H17DRAFT_1073694 [Mycena rosella]|uniref:Uncharacterized protein n=1 Tax=Mycena rosella TaxID=1033263 RepID=A0AAD7D8F2_MYCRO|nr:hypothetical protein B0H17DRAFT_1073694 [Mycena rosella]